MFKVLVAMLLGAIFFVTLIVTLVGVAYESKRHLALAVLLGTAFIIGMILFLHFFGW